MSEDKIKRVYITLNLENKEDKEVYDVLKKKRNKNYYIRQAVLYFNKGIRLDERTREDIREVVRESLKEVLSETDTKEKNQEMFSLEDKIDVTDVTDEAKEEKQRVEDVMEPKPDEVFADEVAADEVIADEVTNENEKELEETLDLSGFEDFF